MTWDNGYKAFFKLHRLVSGKKFGSIPYARKIRNWIYSKSSSSGTPVMVDLPRHRMFVNPADKGVGRNILFKTLTPSMDRVSIDTVSLDHLLRDNRAFDVIKVDIEGAEMQRTQECRA